MPYHRARMLLSEFLPLGKPQTVETTRQRTLRVGARLEQEAVAGAGSKPAGAAKAVTLSIDAGHGHEILSPTDSVKLQLHRSGLGVSVRAAPDEFGTLGRVSGTGACPPESDGVATL